MVRRNPAGQHRSSWTCFPARFFAFQERIIAALAAPLLASLVASPTNLGCATWFQLQTLLFFTNDLALAVIELGRGNKKSAGKE